jgi:tight adherence protein B
MRPMVLLALLLLLITAIGLAFAYVMNRRRQRLLRRIEAAVPPRPLTAPLLPMHDQGLRMRRVQAGEAGLLARIINLPVDLPLANVISPVWVFLVAFVAGAGTVWVGHLLTGWYISSMEGVATAFLVLRWTFGWELGRYRARLIRQLPDAVQLVISATRAGLPVAEAFQAIASEMPSPTRDEFVRVSNEVALGIPAEDALLSMHRRTGVTEYAIFAVTIGVQQRSGGRLAETIQNLADMVRERQAIAARARALAGEAKGSAIIMALLPVAAGIMLSLIQPGHLAPLFHDPRGIRMFVFGVTTLFLGIVTMRQLIRGATRD